MTRGRVSHLAVVCINDGREWFDHSSQNKTTRQLGYSSKSNSRRALHWVGECGTRLTADARSDFPSPWSTTSMMLAEAAAHELESALMYYGAGDPRRVHLHRRLLSVYLIARFAIRRMMFRAEFSALAKAERPTNHQPADKSTRNNVVPVASRHRPTRRASGRRPMKICRL